MLGRWLLATLFAIIVAPPSAPAQAPQRFEVASVRPNPNPHIRPVLFTPPGSPILITNYTLGALVHYAYDLKSSYEMRGGPAWLMKDRFDISAVPPPGSTEEQVPAMLQHCLRSDSAHAFGARLQSVLRDGRRFAWTSQLPGRRVPQPLRQRRGFTLR